MGNWKVVIEGIGPHHGGYIGDANDLTREFVTELAKYGHQIHRATFERVNPNLTENIAPAVDFSRVSP